MPSLHIVSEADGTSWRVWPSPETIPPGAVQEARSYIFELRDAGRAPETDLLIDELPLEALRSHRPDLARWRWQTGFHAGEASAELRQPGSGPIRFEIVTDPDRNKMTREDFDAMLEDILQDSFALFSLTSFHRGIAHGTTDKPPAIARLEYLRSRMDALERVVKEIERRPRHQLRSRDRVVPYHQVRRATGGEVIRSFARGRVARIPPELTRASPTLRGFMPGGFHIRQRYSSTDLPEHRQMAAVLAFWSAWLGVSADQLDRVSGKADPESGRTAALWANRSHRLARRLRAMLEAEPFVGLPHAKPQLQLTSLFRNDRVYRQFYKLYRDFNAALAAIFGDFLNLPLARTYELYELWCFLRLAHAGVKEFGPAAVAFHNLFSRGAAGGVTLASTAVTLKLSPNWEIIFQKRYEEFWTTADGRGSYSRTMTPDIVLAGPAGTGEGAHSSLIVLDSKYRIDTALNDAISSIHTYRDALVEEFATGKRHGIVRAAYLLTPHLPALGSDYRSTSMPGRLFHPDYRSTFRFGAATLRPGMPLSDICLCLQAIIADADMVPGTSAPGV